MQLAISVTAPMSEIGTIVDLARNTHDIEDVSEPSTLDADRALNAAITLDEVKTVLEIVTAVFKSGAALIEFMKAVRETMRARRAAVVVSDPLTGKRLGRIEADTSDETLAEFLVR